MVSPFGRRATRTKKIHPRRETAKEYGIAYGTILTGVLEGVFGVPRATALFGTLVGFGLRKGSPDTLTNKVMQKLIKTTEGDQGSLAPPRPGGPNDDERKRKVEIAAFGGEFVPAVARQVEQLLAARMSADPDIDDDEITVSVLDRIAQSGSGDAQIADQVRAFEKFYSDRHALSIPPPTVDGALVISGAHDIRANQEFDPNHFRAPLGSIALAGSGSMAFRNGVDVTWATIPDFSYAKGISRGVRRTLQRRIRGRSEQTRDFLTQIASNADGVGARFADKVKVVDLANHPDLGKEWG